MWALVGVEDAVYIVVTITASSSDGLDLPGRTPPPTIRRKQKVVLGAGNLCIIVLASDSDLILTVQPLLVNATLRIGQSSTMDVPRLIRTQVTSAELDPPQELVTGMSQALS